ncbi:MAG: hypothetical protein RI907_2221 [Pseudomonadota bacterium]|jgi:hypothetical protein
MPRHLAAARPLLMLASCLLASSAWSATTAQPPMKPGLWEVKLVTREMDGQPLPDMSAMMAQHMDKMPPGTRAKMEAQLKQRGVAMGAGGAMKVCINQEMINAGQWQKHDGRCQNTNVSHSGDTWTVNFTCQNPDAKGEVRTTFQSGEAFTSDMAMTMQRQGKETAMRLRSESKWLGADCGDVQPLGAPLPQRPPAATR